MAVNRIQLLNAPDGEIATADKYQIGVGAYPVGVAPSGNGCYILCSDTNPDKLDFYHSNEIIGRFTSG